MPKEPSTREHVVVARGAVAEAGALVDEADQLLTEALKSAEGEAGSAEGSLPVGMLERVLALDGAAIRLDPEEPAYPWNLGSALSRLGFSELAMGFLARAIRLSAEGGEQDWCGPAARLALAEVALDAASYEIALVALAQAKASDVERLHDREIAELLDELSREQGDSLPQPWLLQLLSQLFQGGEATGDRK